jgi:hypothetical protein
LVGVSDDIKIINNGINNEQSVIETFSEDATSLVPKILFHGKDSLNSEDKVLSSDESINIFHLDP